MADKYTYIMERAIHHTAHYDVVGFYESLTPFDQHLCFQQVEV